MLGRSNEQKKLESNAKTLRKARVAKGLSRNELAKKLNVTDKAIEKIENARDNLSEPRLLKILEALEISFDDFLKIKRGKSIQLKPRLKNVITNSDRRSYQKIITKEVKALKALRVLKKLSQDQASYICGYSRPTIGHIENGRIEIDSDRILHIIKSYGSRIEDFDKYLKVEVMRHEAIEQCKNKILDLSDEKLSLIKGIIDSIG